MPPQRPGDYDHSNSQWHRSVPQNREQRRLLDNPVASLGLGARENLTADDASHGREWQEHNRDGRDDNHESGVSLRQEVERQINGVGNSVPQTSQAELGRPQ